MHGTGRPWGPMESRDRWKARTSALTSASVGFGPGEVNTDGVSPEQTRNCGWREGCRERSTRQPDAEREAQPHREGQARLPADTEKGTGDRAPAGGNGGYREWDGWTASGEKKERRKFSVIETVRTLEV